MSKKPIVKRAGRPRLTAGEQQAEETRRRLRRGVAVARDIKKLARQLQRMNDDAQHELLMLANEICSRADARELLDKPEHAVNG